MPFIKSKSIKNIDNLLIKPVHPLKTGAFFKNINPSKFFNKSKTM
jgi:hypothetical protein